MEINDLLVPEGVVADLKATSKKQALQDLAKCAAEVSGLHERAIFDILMERERLGLLLGRDQPWRDREDGLDPGGRAHGQRREGCP